MSNAQKPNKHRRNKSNHATTTKGVRGHKRPKHGIGKDASRSKRAKKGHR